MTAQDEHLPTVELQNVEAAAQRREAASDAVYRYWRKRHGRDATFGYRTGEVAGGIAVALETGEYFWHCAGKLYSVDGHTRS